MIARTVAADPSLPHQIRITSPNRAGDPEKRHRVEVSCNCRVRRGLPAFGALGENGDSVWEIYQRGAHDTPLTELVSGERTAYAVT